ncbi:MAG: hypothetical protein A2469_04120 [Candidatus Magasanikbacteria bacterium RIFOXYC2_FULL_40_16]|uniref:Mur ligase central domain-containing protein n=2 Tax=Candidatus Magasanikiibacteriota TaxID=1752731 RepID=A0A1F6P0S6_9BACT|nr:MAG: hypothetical protein A2224_01985 [Candidatus Magasanikbacteria bacterium RIFOXYA2_FULL_40_20]OGH89761.1 MAG: hypothetical protein A2469_04120 [Candidatus Magasanikbacteria bacterium RIFOXYC2_FULL_40_16]
MNLFLMFSPINIIIFFLWGVSAFVDYNYFCYLWQLKEYRMDRMRDFMSTQKGKDFWRNYIMLWRSLFACFLFLWPINSVVIVKYFVIIIFGFELIRNLIQLVRRKLRHPVFTKKSTLIIMAAMLVEGLLFVYSRDWPMIFLLMSVRFFVITMTVLLLYLPTNLIKKWFIKKATKKLAGYNELTVIGITGSYGKSTVKSFLSNILSGKFRVIKTPKNINTEIGVAKFILSNNFRNKDIFVVEMGAYRVGEIKLICDMVKPKIGILTAITEQHVSLFGSIKMTQQAKYELLRSLPENGLAVVNSDNKYCREFLDELKCKKATFGVEEVYQPDFLIKKVDNSPGGIIFAGSMYGKDVNTVAPVVGMHNAKNIAPCYLTADFLGMPIEESINQSKKLLLPDNVLSVIKYGEAIVLDDSYNSNYDGFCAGLDVLSDYLDKKRIVVTRGIPELGNSSHEIHIKIGGEIAYIADELIIIDKDNAAALIEGAGSKFNMNIKFIEQPKELLELIKSYKNTSSVILLENRVPDSVMKEINSI